MCDRSCSLTSSPLSTAHQTVSIAKDREFLKRSCLFTHTPSRYIDPVGILDAMSHTIRKKKRLVHRVARIRGQVEALVRALDGEAECGDVLRLIASARGAMDSLMAEVIEGHIRDHAFRGARAKSEERQAAEDLVGIIRSYLK
jgi:DNA-binding FrmR family transcriptional regulator